MKLSILLSLVMVFSPLVLAGSKDSLPNWKSSLSKTRLSQFIRDASDPEAKNYVAKEDRIAIFDVDGTLWVEKPNYAQLDFVLSLKAKELAKAKPKSEKDLLALSSAVFEGVSEKEYQQSAREFLLRKSRHSRYDKKQAQLVYRPMLELMAMLREHDFEIYLCTGSDEGLIRSVSQELFSVPPQNVIAQNVSYVMSDGELVRSGIYRTPINLAEGKVSNLQHRLGKAPVLAVGNSMGDYHMLKWVSRSGGLAALLVHDDQLREYDYGKKNKKLAKAFSGMDIVRISMREEFLQLFGD
ncbi:HAD family hydrolase [uncultured Pseudoteredinibacter sp.]|uniref:HAD family hydrolase n=1 Tax=uncultured Pseudoteredinibacter sp. TaxID=1641701 RepID=UPI00262BF24E|nr:HAD family hydrolase [uncultured Pseudoteredinibacter sp.]